MKGQKLALSTSQEVISRHGALNNQDREVWIITLPDNIFIVNEGADRI
jgi:hypothetical protein